MLRNRTSQPNPATHASSPNLTDNNNQATDIELGFPADYIIEYWKQKEDKKFARKMQRASEPPPSYPPVSAELACRSLECVCFLLCSSIHTKYLIVVLAPCFCPAMTWLVVWVKSCFWGATNVTRHAFFGFSVLIFAALSPLAPSSRSRPIFRRMCFVPKKMLCRGEQHRRYMVDWISEVGEQLALQVRCILRL